MSALLLHNKAQHRAVLGRGVSAPQCGGNQEGSQFKNWGRLKEKKSLRSCPEKGQAVSVRGGSAACLCKSDLETNSPRSIFQQREGGTAETLLQVCSCIQCPSQNLTLGEALQRN